MKFVIIALISLLSFNVMAQEGKMGFGVSLGNPTGLNGKYWLDSKTAIDGGVAMSLGDSSDLSVHSDFLFHNEGAFFFNDVNPLDLYYGLGARMEFEDDIELGVRVPVGLAHKIENQSADVFAEVAPIFDFITSKGIELHILAGGRYYF